MQEQGVQSHIMNLPSCYVCIGGEAPQNNDINDNRHDKRKQDSEHDKENQDSDEDETPDYRRSGWGWEENLPLNHASCRWWSTFGSQVKDRKRTDNTSCR